MHALGKQSQDLPQWQVGEILKTLWKEGRKCNIDQTPGKFHLLPSLPGNAQLIRILT